MTGLSRVLLYIGLAIGVFSLVTSFAMSIMSNLGAGNTITYAIGRYFGFLTILTNTWLVLIYLAELTGASSLRFFRNHAIQSGALATILLVAIYQHAVLYAGSEPLVGLSWLNDFIHHSLAPIVYVLWWLVTSPRENLKWSSLPLMLAPLIVYAIYVLARGPIINEYPYPALDVTVQGYAGALSFMGIITIAMLVLAGLIVLLNQLLSLFKSPAS